MISRPLGHICFDAMQGPISQKFSLLGAGQGMVHISNNNIDMRLTARHADK